MRTVLVLLLLQTFFRGYSQTQKNLDLIICIDEEIAVGSISSLNVEIIKGKERKDIDISYYPGNLSLSQDDYDEMMSAQTDTIFLKFYYNLVTESGHYLRGYRIELKKEWLHDYYNILRIYNLDQNKYSKIFNASNGDGSFVYELDSPSHGFRLIRKRYKR